MAVVRYTALHANIAAESVTVLRFHAELVAHDTLSHLEEADALRVDLADEAVTLKEGNGWLHIYLAGVALATQVELNRWDG